MMSENTHSSVVRAFNLPRVGQLGFIFNSIEDSLPYYASFYNHGTPV
jgi:hypothetical protein